MFFGLVERNPASVSARAIAQASGRGVTGGATARRNWRWLAGFKVMAGPPRAGEAMTMWPGDYDVAAKALRLRGKWGGG
jgi:hypothetical protein